MSDVDRVIKAAIRLGQAVTSLEEEKVDLIKTRDDSERKYAEAYTRYKQLEKSIDVFLQ